MSDVIDFDPPSSDEQQDFVSTNIASLSGRAVLPSGELLDRAAILDRLGLNPGTSPTAWLAVIGCGSNASALKPGDLDRIAVQRLANASSVMSKVRGLQGFADGGKAQP